MTRRGFGAVAGGATLALCLMCAPALAQDAKFGRDVWLGQANCADCHGWMGDGNNEDPRSPRGANLRQTELDKDSLVEVILCGIPGTSMPHFDPKGYVDDRCYGATRAEMGDATPPTGAAALTKRHATGLANFILETFAGKGEPTKAECIELLGEGAKRCAGLPE